MTKNTWQSYSIETSNLTDEQKSRVEAKLNEACKELELEGIDIESCNGIDSSSTYVLTDSGEFYSSWIY